MQRRGKSTRNKKSTRGRKPAKKRKYKKSQSGRGHNAEKGIFWLDVRKGDFYTKYRFTRRSQALRSEAEHRRKGYEAKVFRQGAKKRMKALRTAARR